MAAAGEKTTTTTTTTRSKISRAVNYGSLVCADMAMAFLWVSLNAFVRVAVELGFVFVDMGGRQLLKKGLVVVLLFLFSWLSKLSNGATYNPLTVIAYAAAGITHHPLAVLSFRIPAQVSSFRHIFDEFYKKYRCKTLSHMS